jgi:hypothetical protein
MGKSPTLNKIEDNLSRIKKRLGIKDETDNNNTNDRKKVIIVLYMVVTFSLLILYKPKLVCVDKPYDHENNTKISYSKFFLYYLLIQAPIVLYSIF